jgi:hypothetical protein
MNLPGLTENEKTLLICTCLCAAYILDCPVGNFMVSIELHYSYASISSDTFCISFNHFLRE